MCWTFLAGTGPAGFLRRFQERSVNPDKERLRSFPGPMVTPGRLPLAVEARVLPARSDTWIFVRSVFAHRLETNADRTWYAASSRLSTAAACRLYRYPRWSFDRWLASLVGSRPRPVVVNSSDALINCRPTDDIPFLRLVRPRFDPVINQPTDMLFRAIVQIRSQLY